MKPKQPNLLQYMNFSKKNKSTNKAKYKTIMPNYIDSFSNKYPSYLQSSINEDILLLKKKLKGYSKIHSHSSNNTNKNIEVNKKPQIASNISNVSPISQINNYFLKKKNNNAYINKEIKNNLMLTSINNSSIIYTSKDKEKIINNKSSSFRGINSNINYNYNINKNINKNLNKNVNNVYNNNPYEKKIKFNNNNKENKKYSMTSVSSRKASKERENPKKQEGSNNINKINFNGLFKNFNYNKGKFLNNNYINNNKIINENIYMKNLHNNNYNNNNNINKKLFVCDFNNVKKNKLLNDFLESYLKAPQSNNNRSTKNKNNNYSNSNISSNINTNINSNKNISSTANTSLIKNNCFPLSSSNYSPNNEEDFFKTAKISPRSSFPKKNQEFIQSHKINVKNKLQGNILSFYNNYKNSVNNNNNMMGNSSNINLDNNDISSHINKKKKSNMSVNMNITYNNKHFNMSNLGKNKNRSMINSDDIIENNFNYNINKTNKSNSLNKIQNINYIENYNYNYNLINKNTNNTNNNIINNNHHSSNNSFINIKKSQNLIMNGNNILNNCKININNINYNNYNNSNNNNINNNNINSNTNLNNNNYNHIFNEKMIHYNDKKNSIEIPNNNKTQNNKVNSQSQQELTQIKKNKNKNFTTNNSPINKNINIKNRISNNNSQNSTKINNNNINSYSSKNSKKNNNNNNNSIKAKETKKIKYEIKQKPKPKTNNNSLLFDNKIYEILELKHNLQKNNSEIYISEEKNEKKSKELSSKNGKNGKNGKIEKDKDKESINNNYNNKNTISNLSSTTHDSNYYMEKCNSLSKYIRDYYRRYKNYPNTNLNFYLYGRLIGQGAFGKVNIGLNILSGRVVAIKSFNKKSLSTNGDNMKKILSETDLMKKLNHPNVTKILEMFEDDEYILIAMEYINGGNLFSFVKKRRKLSEKTAKFLFRQIILGIKHIHSKKIVHRDIKLENILIDLNNNIKICDFGIGRILKNEKQLLYDKCGTPMYMAPEILLSSKTKGYEGFPVDIWSSGISLYIMLSGTLPFNLKNNESSDMSEESNNNIELQYSIINKEPKKIEKISDEARDLLKGLLNKNPRKRLTIEQILNHPWLMENSKKNFKNKKYHLFTKAEMIMLSKTYIDYRNSLIEDLKENFTISNLKLENKENPDKTKKLKNITTKSSLLAPYNTLIQNEESFSEEGDNPDEFDDLANPNIILENDILIINNKIKEFNLNYELNNNGECDNGMLINTKTETISSSVNNQSQISSRNDNEDDLDDISDNDENEEHEKKTEKILEEIERIGYDRKYVMNCVKNNELCHASAIFYLMMNYKDI